MAIELTDELIELERAAGAAHDEVRRLQAAPGRPTVEWTPEEHEAWNAAADRWREAATAMLSAVAEHAEATGQGRMAVEMAVKAAVRHPEPEGAEG